MQNSFFGRVTRNSQPKWRICESASYQCPTSLRDAHVCWFWFVPPSPLSPWCYLDFPHLDVVEANTSTATQIAPSVDDRISSGMHLRMGFPGANRNPFAGMANQNILSVFFSYDGHRPLEWNRRSMGRRWWWRRNSITYHSGPIPWGKF